jgi:hypothetical protein
VVFRSLQDVRNPFLDNGLGRNDSLALNHCAINQTQIRGTSSAICTQRNDAMSGEQVDFLHLSPFDWRYVAIITPDWVDVAVTRASSAYVFPAMRR